MEPRLWQIQLCGSAYQLARCSSCVAWAELQRARDAVWLEGGEENEACEPILGLATRRQGRKLRRGAAVLGRQVPFTPLWEKGALRASLYVCVCDVYLCVRIYTYVLSTRKYTALYEPVLSPPGPLLCLCLFLRRGPVGKMGGPRAGGQE